MAILLATVGALAGLGTLLVAGCAHVIHFRQFRDSVAEHKLWPRWLVTSISAGVVAVEIAVGSAGFLALVGGSVWVLRVTLVIAASAYVCFGLYSLLLLGRRPEVPCACTSGDHPVNIGVPSRAVALAAGCGYAAATTASVAAWSNALDTVLILLTTVTSMVLAWAMPAALHDPNRQVSQRRRDAGGLPWTSAPLH